MRKYTLNERFFDKLNEKKAYVLGFWWADGSIEIRLSKKTGNRRYARFVIANKELNHLKLIAKIIGWNGPIRKTKSKGKICYRLLCSSNKLVDSLIKIGARSRKSFQPNLPVLPSKLLRHFVRGLFDGDGGICYKKYKNRHKKYTSELTTYFSAGNCTFLKNLIKILHEECGLRIKEPAHTSPNGWKIHFAQYDSYLLCNWIYKKCTIFMPRKKRIWEGADKVRLKRSLKFANKPVV